MPAARTNGIRFHETAFGWGVHMSTILIVLLVLLLLAAIPAWPYSRGWGYGPSGILGLIVLILIILAVMGRL